MSDRSASAIALGDSTARALLESAAEGIYGRDAEGKTTFVNPAAARMLGWDPEELVEKS